ncbi:MAG: MBL fold metallo-hydrolase [Solobacterium sp.]|nr:MBL fold metallo-hydrolase [Solobacterium sp.]
MKQAVAERIPMNTGDFDDQGKTLVYWLGNGGAMINSHGTVILIDPLLRGFDMPVCTEAPIMPEEIPAADAVLITHCDNDHFSKETIKSLKGKVREYHTTHYVASLFKELGIEAYGHDIGETFEVNGVKITLTPADHAWQNDSPKHSALRHYEQEDFCGFYLHTTDGSVWMPGDSRLMEEQLRFEEPDMILMDISDSRWHIGLDGVQKMSEAYPNAYLLPIHWGCVASEMKEFNGDPETARRLIRNSYRFHVKAAGEAVTLRPRWEAMLEKYKDWEKKCSAYAMALAVIGIDKLTVAPPAGAAYRDERSAILAGELFTLQTDSEIQSVLKELQKQELVDEDTRKAAYLYDRDLSHITNIPKDFYIEYQMLQNESYNAWLEAKTKNDYSIFEPYLKRIIEMSRKMYEFRDCDQDIYDQMLDDYEPGMTKEKYDVFFTQVKERLVPLIQKVVHAEPIRDEFLYQSYPVEDQKKFMDDVLKYLRFDPSWGYQNETEHPFTSGTCQNDMRTTTKYLENSLASAILSTVHEVGHATYGHDVDPAYDGTILTEGISSGMHESQSRLFENYLGRTGSFWYTLYPKLQERFPEQLNGVTLEMFVKAINVSKLSLIRTEADELTYPLHILIRYELEKGLFDSSISTEGLDQTWDHLYQKYLGIHAEKSSQGILQDVHWADGSFGYFPTYALGSAMSAQFMHQMRKDIDVDRYLREDRFDLVVDWLRENIHRYGCRYNAEEVMIRATGEPFDVKYYLDYLEEKYTKLYNL